MAQFFELWKETELLELYIRNNIQQMLKATFKYEEVTAKLFSENKKVVLEVFSCSELTYSSEHLCWRTNCVIWK
jgi:hypothetical protein